MEYIELKLNKLNKAKIFLLVLLISFGFKSTIIYLTPYANTQFVDLGIYIDGGQLLTNHINPYDFNDNINKREQLRLDNVGKSNLTSSSQETWNKYASGNLPLSLIFYGFIDSISSGNPILYRQVFALFDSLLSALIFILVFYYWKVPTSNIHRFFIGIFLGFGSAFLFYDGLLIPEDKGVQILFMLLAIYFSKKRNIILSTIFLAASICFKGLGIFIIPLCIVYLFANNSSKLIEVNSRNFKKISYYLIAVLIICILIFLPFGSKVFEMALNRLNEASSKLPMQSSIWVLPYLVLESNYIFLKYFSIILFCLLNVYGFITKKLSLEIVTTSVLLVFVIFLLTAGSMNRINMAILPSIIIIGVSNSEFDKENVLSKYYIFGGWLTFISIIVWRFYLKKEDFQTFDGIFTIIFLIIYFILIVKKIFFKRESQNLNLKFNVFN